MAGNPKYDAGIKLADQMTAWQPPSDLEHHVHDPFTLMEAIVRGSTPQGIYFAHPGLLHRVQWWQDDWDSEAVRGWLATLVEWGEITLEPLGRDVYSPAETFNVIVIQNQRRFRRFAARPPFTVAQRTAVYARDGGACVLCGSTENLSIDHIHPWSRGGEHEMSNFQTLCRSCNSKKGNRI